MMSKPAEAVEAKGLTPSTIANPDEHIWWSDAAMDKISSERAAENMGVLTTFFTLGEMAKLQHSPNEAHASAASISLYSGIEKREVRKHLRQLEGLKLIGITDGNEDEQVYHLVAALPPRSLGRGKGRVGAPINIIFI